MATVGKTRESFPIESWILWGDNDARFTALPSDTESAFDERLASGRLSKLYSGIVIDTESPLSIVSFSLENPHWKHPKWKQNESLSIDKANIGGR